MFGLDCRPYRSHSEYLDFYLRNATYLKKRYLQHNLYVKSKVDEKKLLVWNLKDGWEPLCNFLNKPIPPIPLPKVNMTKSDTKIERKLLCCQKLNFKKIAFYLITALFFTLLLIYGFAKRK